MTWKQQVLVLANVTATSPDLLEALQQRAESGSAAFTLLVPAPPGHGRLSDAAQQQLAEAVAMVRKAGLDVEGVVGDCDPMVAVTETWDPRRFDEIIVSTFPGERSGWLRRDLVGRLRGETGLPVEHVVTQAAEVGALA